MSEKKTPTDASHAPRFDAFSVTDAAEGRTPFWTKIGAAFAHTDGKGFTIMLNALPVNAKILLRAPEEKSSRTTE